MLRFDVNKMRTMTTAEFALLFWEYGLRRLLNIDFFNLSNMLVYGNFNAGVLLALLGGLGAYWMYKRLI